METAYMTGILLIRELSKSVIYISETGRPLT